MTRADRWPGEPSTWLIEQTAAEIADTVGYLERVDAGRAFSPTDPPREELVGQLATELAEVAALIAQLAEQYGIGSGEALKPVSDGASAPPPVVSPPPAEPVVLPAPHPLPEGDR